MHFVIPRQYESIVPRRSRSGGASSWWLWIRLPIQGLFALLTWRGTN
jgi:hypothetical protein